MPSARGGVTPSGHGDRGVALRERRFLGRGLAAAHRLAALEVVGGGVSACGADGDGDAPVEPGDVGRAGKVEIGEADRAGGGGLGLSMAGDDEQGGGKSRDENRVHDGLRGPDVERRRRREFLIPPAGRCP